MRIRPSLTAGAIAAVAAIAFAVPGVTAAAQPAPQPSYQATSGQATTGKVSGILPARGHNSQKFAAMVKKVGVNAAPAASAACTEPNCPLVYNGGPVQHTPRVFVVFWGSKWNTTAAASAKSYITGLYTGLGLTGKGDFWSGIVKQYGDTSGQPVTIDSSMLVGTWVDTSLRANSATNGITIDELGQEAFNAAAHFNFPNPTQSQIVVASQQGTCFAPLDPTDPTSTFAGNCGTPATTAGSQYCGFHTVDGITLSDGSTSYLPWTTVPYQPDAQLDCTFDTPTTVNDGFSIVGGHEFAETVSDPNTTSVSTLAWDDLADPSGGEVGDKCAFVPPQLNLALNGHTYAMQSLWSNATNGCATTGALGLKVTTPAAQSSTIGTAISPLQITASTADPTPLTYTATGLPPGLSINKTTGVISGTPGVTAGTFTTKVTVAYYYSQGTVAFTWKVASTPGNIKGWASKCVADYQAKTTPYSRIVLWPCANTASMNITFLANRELLVVGRCLTASGTKVVIGVCAGAASQTWTRLSNGEYQLKSNGECLTAPGQTTGLQLVLAVCKNAGNQRWSLPS
ncbi:MAG TPA: putative Ig domain-containing protein [Trebonia sp.]|jgi:serine protease